MAVNLHEARVRAEFSEDGELIRALVEQVEKMAKLKQADDLLLSTAMAELAYATSRAAKLQKQNQELRDLMLEATKSGIDVPIDALTK